MSVMKNLTQRTYDWVETFDAEDVKSLGPIVKMKIGGSEFLTLKNARDFTSDHEGKTHYVRFFFDDDFEVGSEYLGATAKAEYATNSKGSLVCNVRVCK